MFFAQRLGFDERKLFEFFSAFLHSLLLEFEREPFFHPRRGDERVGAFVEVAVTAEHVADEKDFLHAVAQRVRLVERIDLFHAVVVQKHYRPVDSLARSYNAAFARPFGFHLRSESWEFVEDYHGCGVYCFREYSHEARAAVAEAEAAFAHWKREYGPACHDFFHEPFVGLDFNLLGFPLCNFNQVFKPLPVEPVFFRYLQDFRRFQANPFPYDQANAAAHAVGFDRRNVPVDAHFVLLGRLAVYAHRAVFHHPNRFIFRGHVLPGAGFARVQIDFLHVPRKLVFQRAEFPDSEKPPAIICEQKRERLARSPCAADGAGEINAQVIASVGVLPYAELGNAFDGRRNHAFGKQRQPRSYSLFDELFSFQPGPFLVGRLG